MCGSLLSKFNNPSNKVDPGIAIFPEPRRVRSRTKLADEDSACYEDRGFWKNGDSNGDSGTHSLATLPSKFELKDECPSESDSSSKENIEAALCALNCAKPVLPAINSSNVGLPLAERNSEHLLESAREILAFQAYDASSSSNTVAAQPLSSTNATFLKMTETAVTFDIKTGEENTICPSARVPRRLRKRGKVAPELTFEEVSEKMRAAEERKLKELERIREGARSRAGMRRPHPAEVSAQATQDKIAAKQAAAEIKRNEEMEKRKEASNRASRSRNRIAAARDFSKTQLESSIERKMEETEQRKAKHQQKMDKKKKLKEKYAKRVKDRVTKMKKQKEEEALADLQELETYVTSDSDESWGDEHEDKVVHEWEDFFVD